MQHDAHIRDWRLWNEFNMRTIAKAQAFQWWKSVFVDGDTNVITSKQLIENIDNLKVTFRQKEFIKAAFRALISCVLSKQFNARIDI